MHGFWCVSMLVSVTFEYVGWFCGKRDFRRSRHPALAFFYHAEMSLRRRLRKCRRQTEPAGHHHSAMRAVASTLFLRSDFLDSFGPFFIIIYAQDNSRVGFVLQFKYQDPFFCHIPEFSSSRRMISARLNRSWRMRSRIPYFPPACSMSFSPNFYNVF